MIDGSVLQSAQKCFEKKSRVVVKMVVSLFRKTIVRPVVLNLRKTFITYKWKEKVQILVVGENFKL